MLGDKTTGQPSKINALTSLLDYMLPAAPAGKIGQFAGNVYNWLGAVNTASDLFPDKQTTVASAIEYSGTFSHPWATAHPAA